jgi:hypothetical protein
MADVYYRKTALLEAELGAEIVALDADSGICFGFNEVASTVWRLLEQPRSSDEISRVLEDEYDVGSEQCRKELSELLDDLVGKGVIGVRRADES